MKTKSKITAIILIFFLFICPSTASVTADIKESRSVYLGGEPFGIKMLCDGVLVIGMQDVETSSGKENPAKDCGIKVNDVILAADDEKIMSSDELRSVIEGSDGMTISLTICRNEKVFETELTPVSDQDGILRAGLWIKDSAAGLGTITFYSEDNERFCGLGHAICEAETGTVLPLRSGDVELAYITSVTRSSGSDIGTLNGYFTGDDIGEALKNLENGIYGSITHRSNTKRLIEIANAEDVRLGDATVFTTVDGSVPKEYEAEIIRVFPNDERKNIVIKITDEELLEKTGGIVQGMSGSPIVQDGRLVGAVTHVIVDKADCGYGIFAERMLETLTE